jgi:hypothetical protein
MTMSEIISNNLHFDSFLLHLFCLNSILVVNDLLLFVDVFKPQVRSSKQERNKQKSKAIRYSYPAVL